MSKAEIQTDESGIDRRTFLRSGAGAVTAAATVGAGSMQHPQLSPVGQTEAIAPAAAGALLASGTVAGALTGLAIADIAGGGDAEEIGEATVENEVHSTAQGIASQRESNRDETEARWIDKEVDRTPTADSIFTEAEALAAESIVSGDDQNALSIAQDAVDKHITIALYNMYQGWNEAFIGSSDVDGLVAAITASLTYNTNQFSADEDLESATVEDMTSGGEDYIEPVEASEVKDEDGNGTGEYALFEVEIPGELMPMNPEAIEEIPEDNPTVIAYVRGGGLNARDLFVDWPNIMDWFKTNFTEATQWNDPIEVSHPDRTTVVPLDGTLYVDFQAHLFEARDELITQIETYVDVLNDQLAEGIIDPADILSPQAAIEQFADTSEQQQVAAQLAFTGAHVPRGEMSFQAEVSHPDIESDSLWGTLFIAFADDDAAGIEGPTTIPSEDYELGYLQFFREDTGDNEVRLLSGEHDLEILDVTGLDEDSELTFLEEGDGRSVEAGENGRVVVWDEEWGETPDVFAFPNDHDDWTVIIEGDINRHTAPVSEVEHDDSEGEYFISPTDLEEGESVHRIRTIQHIEMDQPTQYVQQPGELNTEDIEERLEAMRELQEEIEELGDIGIGDGGTGGLFDGLTSGLRDGFQMVVGGMILFILFIFGLTAASG